ncbi:WYL domain-containing protein [Haloactinospora alba]|uniref:WYL domain-containing protein n=1 Tax=Haloactinospora alba TaxID=405555 RepID=A0A543NFY2_9ACTN|nr:WYL domain-containing protein [Haloactinospora alba]TQN30747.1 WYL domain-containing protein [Haloactinospora alba]
MRINTSTGRTLAHLVGAAEATRAVTLRYVKENGEVSRRAVELHAVEVTAAGDIVLRAFDRRSGATRSFRLDRVTHFRIHRAPHLADYRAPVTPVADPVATDDSGDAVAVQPWTSAYTLAA